MYNVLIVDDEKIEREGIRFLLSREEGDFHILEASNGKQALNVLRSENIDLLLTDIKMPHMDGLELSKRAKEENEELQIVIFSGYNDFTFAQEAIRYGVKEYVLKPVDPDIFHETIGKIKQEIEKIKITKSAVRKNRISYSSIFCRITFMQEKKKFWRKPGIWWTWRNGISGTVGF